MHGVERHGGAKGRINPGTNGPIAGKARRLSEFGLQDHHLIGGQGRHFAGGHIDLKERLKTTGGIGREPLGDGIATDPEQIRDLRPRAGLLTGQEIQHMQALTFGALAFGGEALFEDLDILVNRGQIFPHGRPLSFTDDRHEGYPRSAYSARLNGISKLEYPEINTTNKEVCDFGNLLYNTLFPGKILAIFISVRDQAERENRELRIKLVIRPKYVEFASIPWEFACDDVGNPLLSKFFLYRSLPRSESLPPLRVPKGMPLKILLTSALPTNLKDIYPIDIDKEIALIRQALSSVENIEIVEIPRLTPKKLSRALTDHRPHIFHFIGHGTFTDDTGFLILEDDEGLRNDYSAIQLLRVLSGKVRLALINACNSGKISNNVLNGIAPALIGARIPAVIGMQSLIENNTGEIFAQEFYRNLVKNGRIDTSINEGRNLVMAEGNKIDWGLITLYMRSSDEEIFDFTDLNKLEDEDLLKISKEIILSEREQLNLEFKKAKKAKNIANIIYFGEILLNFDDKRNIYKSLIDAYYEYSFIEADKNSFNNAIDLLRKAKKIDKLNNEKYERYIRKYTQKEKAFQIYIQSKYIDIKEYAIAIKLIDDAIAMDSMRHEYYVYRGYIHENNYLYQHAISDYESAVDILENEIQNNNKKDKLMELNYEIMELHKQCGLLNMIIRKYSDAIFKFTNAIDIQKQVQYDYSVDDFELYKYRANSFMEYERYDHAIKDYNFIINKKEMQNQEMQNQEGAASLYFSRGLVYQKKRLHALAIKDFTCAIDLKKTDNESLEHLYYYHRGLSCELLCQRDFQLAADLGNLEARAKTRK